MSLAVFSIGAFCGLLLLGFAVVGLLWERLSIWPPPSPVSWQARLFRWLFRGLVYATIIVTAITLFLRWRAGLVLPPWQTGLGAALLLAGFGAAFFCTFVLGWGRAFGEDTGLKRGGIFARSRNPIYVFTWIGLLGWGALAASPMVTGLLAIWAGIYGLAVFLEERSLRAQYGEAFEDYCGQVPRFIGTASFTISKPNERKNG